MFPYISGQNLCGCPWRSHRKVVINDGMGDFMGKHFSEQILNIEINSVVFKNIPGAKFSLYIYIEICRLQSHFIGIELHNYVYGFSHIQN